MKAFFDCRACVERASDFLNGDLPPMARFITHVHLVLCRDCRVHAKQLETTVSALGQIEPSPGLSEGRKSALLDALRAKK